MSWTLSRWVGCFRRAFWGAYPQSSRVVMIKLISSLRFNKSSLLLFSRWPGAFPHVGEQGLFQTSWEKCQPKLLIVNLSFCVFQMSWPLPDELALLPTSWLRRLAHNIFHVHVSWCNLVYIINNLIYLLNAEYLLAACNMFDASLLSMAKWNSAQRGPSSI